MTRLQDCIDKIIKALEEAKTILAEENPVLTAQKTPTESPQEEFAKLKELLMSPKWPEAVNLHLVANPDNENEKMERGLGIVDLMIGGSHLKGLKFLDYGCGDGYCVKAALDLGANAVGYDIKKYDSWWTEACTQDWEKVKQQGPFDVILCYDVLDHVVGERPVAVLQKLNELLSPEGKIYLRMHPICSRHGAHHWFNINKAYAHIVFTPEELKEIDPKWATSPHIEPTLPHVFPVRMYQAMIEAAGLHIEDKRESLEAVEMIFKTPLFAKRIMQNLKINEFPDFPLSVQFIDYVLTRKPQ